MLKKCAMLAGLVFILSPAAARADWLFTPHVGATFGGGGSFTYGASIGWMGAGIVGFETEFAFTPGFLGLDVEDDLDLLDDAIDFDLVDDQAMSVMFNAIVGVPIGGTGGTGFRPYVSGGLGLVAVSIESDELLFDESENKFGFNLGGGAMGYFGNVGIRGDIRYYQTLADSVIDEFLDVEVGDVDFWRGTVGVVFRW
jgi:opacity protein-like surface antigen